MSNEDQDREEPSGLTPPGLAEDIQRVAQAEASRAEANPSLFIAEQEHLKAEQLRLKNKRLTDELQEAKELHKYRKRYTSRLFWVIVLWLIAVNVYVILTATRKASFDLPDGVLIAFITSTTVAVIGLFVIVAKWLFPSANKEEGKAAKNE
ncbi:MAG TPA: hypothetical protein VGX48_16290 [Pyrinomonadaceae bacterium]|jgi:hypothetical protein|nr:hypothetical protein [Pyrinomonadaceae bacterium]